MSDDIHIGIVAGEQSGDTLGAGLLMALRQQFPEARFSGIGGPRMTKLGFSSLAPMERLAVMGFVEPLGRLPELLRIKRQIEKHFLTDRPAVYIGIDAPDFNLRVEENLKRAGIKTVHYVSPSVWAYRAGRIHKIKRAVDIMLTLFPFETGIYAEHGITAYCTGHPLADVINPPQQNATQGHDQSSEQGHDAEQGHGQGNKQHDERHAEQRARFNLEPSAPVVALMPGSRSGEIKRLMPVFLAAAMNALEQNPALRYIIPCVSPEAHAQITTLMEAEGILPGLQFLLVDDSHAAISAADLVLLASGTATLEAMLLRRPMVVCYKLAPITYALASRMIRVPYMALPNLLAGKALVPEYKQNAVQAPVLSQHIIDGVAGKANHEAMLAEFNRLHQMLRKNASVEAARVIAECI
ncbi:MAG: lipid-A-disaccharide synthase [Pseudohongiellaceae bacterium]